MIGFSNINWISIATSQLYPTSYDNERYYQQEEITRISAKHLLNITKKVFFYLPPFSFISIAGICIGYSITHEIMKEQIIALNVSIQKVNDTSFLLNCPNK